MHVAVIGAGALGLVYGVRLAVRGGASVTFVVRPRRVAETAPFVIESASRDDRETLDAPARAAVVPGDADIVLLAVGTEDLDALDRPLGDSDAPIVVLTPMMPSDWARVRSRWGDRVHAAMPNVISYVRDDGVVRYWLQALPTMIDEPRAGGHGVMVRALADALRAAGLATRLELGVHENNPATTLCFLPLFMTIGLSPSFDAFVHDDAAILLARRACEEGVALAARVGRAEPIARFAPLAIRPLAMRMVVGALARFSPEAVAYVEHHFGEKLRVQNRAMADTMVALAKEKAMPHDALSELAARLAAVVPT